MKNETILAVIDEIKELTSVNDHNEALIIGSTLLDNIQESGETIRTKVLKHVREIHYLKGHMPSGLIEMREESRPWIMNGLKEVLSDSEYTALEGSY